MVARGEHHDGEGDQQGEDDQPGDVRDGPHGADSGTTTTTPAAFSTIDRGDQVPRTSVGKFDKKVIRRRYADGDIEVSG